MNHAFFIQLVQLSQGALRRQLMVCPKSSENPYRIAESLRNKTGADLLILDGSAAADQSRYEDIFLARNK